MIINCDICNSVINDVKHIIRIPHYNEKGDLHYHERICYNCLKRILSECDYDLNYLWNILLFNVQEDTKKWLITCAKPIKIAPNGIELLVDNKNINILESHKLNIVITLMTLFNIDNYNDVRVKFITEE